MERKRAVDLGGQGLANGRFQESGGAGGVGLEEQPLECCPPSKSFKWQVPGGTTGLGKQSPEAAESFQTHFGQRSGPELAQGERH